MKILIMTHTIDPTVGGWGRYAHDLKKALMVRGHIATALPEIVSSPLSNPVRYLSSPVSFFLAEYKVIRKAIQTFQPDVVHIVVEPYLLLVPFLPLERIRVVLTVHGTYADIPAQASWWWRCIARFLFVRGIKKVSHIITVSNYTKNYFLETMRHNRVVMDPSCITTIHNSIDTTNYLFNASKQQKKINRILTVAPVKSRKGIREAIRALAEYRKRYSGKFAYHVVGSCDERSAYVQSLNAEICSLGLENTVSFLGRVSEESLQEEYARADLFLMLPVTSNEQSFEGFGLVYLEANACGVPTIGSCDGGSAEAIKDGISGFVVDAYTPSVVAEKIFEVLDKGGINRDSAREWAEEHDISKVIHQVLELYEK